MQEVARDVQFYLALVTSGGTRRQISICHGCHGTVNNPPINVQDEFVVVCRDHYQLYKDRYTGLPRISTKARNLHFHMTPKCVWLRYPSFEVTSLHIPPNIAPRLNTQHKRILLEQFHKTSFFT